MILAYIGKEINREDLIQIFEQLNLSYKELFDDDLDRRIGVLLQKEEEAEKKNSRKSFLLFSQIDDKQMDQLRTKMKEKGIYIPRIAMETEHNVHWTLGDLMEEIDQEIEYFKLRDAIIEKLKKPNFSRIKKDPNYIKMVSSMIDRISSEDVTIHELKEFYRYLYKI